MKDFRPCTIELDAAMVEFLEHVKTSHDLPDVGKAVRCLVNYARDNPEKRDEIFSDVRCLEC